MTRRAIGLVAFDLDGTLVRGETCCEAIARPLGQLDRMRAFERLSTVDEIASAREAMVAWYGATALSELCAPLQAIELAPGVREGFALLRQHGVKTAIVSITWEFAVAWFAQQLRADYSVGTGLTPDGAVVHFWPADKARWVTDLAQQLGLALADVAAVGDSAGDLPMLRIVGAPFFVGQRLPEGAEAIPHWPAGNIYQIARRIVERPLVAHGPARLGGGYDLPASEPGNRS